MSQERDKLITENINLVYYVLHRSFPRLAKDEDWRQEGMIGLIQAADTYDQNSGASFANYACTCIRNRLCHELRKTNRLQNNVPIDELYNQPPIHQDYTQRYVVDFISTLNPRQRAVLELRMLGYKQQVIATKVGMSSQGVSNMLQRIGVLWNRFNRVLI